MANKLGVLSSSAYPKRVLLRHKRKQKSVHTRHQLIDDKIVCHEPVKVQKCKYFMIQGGLFKSNDTALPREEN